nr:SKP1-like protein 11 [Malus domestica]
MGEEGAEGAEGVGDMVMPVPNVHSAELVNIIDFCTKNPTSRDGADLGCRLLHVDLLLEVLNQTVADRIKNKNVEHMRKLFGVESDYTPEEEQKLCEEYAWAFERHVVF